MTLWAAVLLVAAVATHEEDIYAPIFHVSPAGCGGGWLNDPNAPFEFKGRHHLFYQYAKDDAPGPGPGGRLISWGHVAGNLSHATCLPPALVPGVDGDGSSTPYDARGVFTGSVTVVGGRPVATYPAMPGSHMASAWPVRQRLPALRERGRAAPSSSSRAHERLFLEAPEDVFTSVLAFWRSDRDD